MLWAAERIPPHRNALRQNGEELSGDGETGLHPTFLQKVMQLRGTADITVSKPVLLIRYLIGVTSGCQDVHW